MFFFYGKEAFYSAKAAELYGYSIYLDKNNQEVKVTLVCRDALKGWLNYKFDDKVYVGRVDKFVRKVHSKQSAWSIYKIYNNKNDYEIK